MKQNGKNSVPMVMGSVFCQGLLYSINRLWLSTLVNQNFYYFLSAPKSSEDHCTMMDLFTQPLSQHSWKPVNVFFLSVSMEVSNLMYLSSITGFGLIKEATNCSLTHGGACLNRCSKDQLTALPIHPTIPKWKVLWVNHWPEYTKSSQKVGKGISELRNWII